MENNMQGPTSPTESPGKAKRFLTAKYVFDGQSLLEGSVLVLTGDEVEGIEPLQCQSGIEDLGEETVLTCGMIDLQMNGGGGRQFNEEISTETLEAMRNVCLRHGTIGFLPSMLTSSFEDMRKSLETVMIWVKEHGLGRGVLGIHLEGPFISQAKKGIHVEGLLQEATQEKIEVIADYAGHFPILLTVAPEKVSPEQVKYLASKGVVVSVGHSNASYEEAKNCFDAGATAVTHLYNAMSGLTGRDPGVIGAVLNNPTCFVGIIPDLHHVHPANIEIAAKLKPDHLVFVTDCHSPVGTDITEFKLNGRQMFVRDRKCVDASGSLSGSFLLMNEAIQNAVKSC
jgi:N-acetylglucosamine-6-phosphate deacetylase